VPEILALGLIAVLVAAGILFLLVMLIYSLIKDVPLYVVLSGIAAATLCYATSIDATLALILFGTVVLLGAIWWIVSDEEVKPWYVLVGGVIAAVLWQTAIIDALQASVFYLIYVALGFGWLWLQECERRSRAEMEAAERKRREEEQARKAQEAAQREAEEERASTRSENKELVDKVAELVFSSGGHALEMMRAVSALKGGTDLVPPANVVLIDITEILSTIWKASGGLPAGVARLYHAIKLQLEPNPPVRVKHCPAILQEHRPSPVNVPTMVTLLAAYDEMQKTAKAAKA